MHMRLMGIEVPIRNQAYKSYRMSFFKKHVKMQKVYLFIFLFIL